MGKTYVADISAMAILYNYYCDKTGMISNDKILEFTDEINRNLKEGNEFKVINVKEYTDITLYYTSRDEFGNNYVILDPNADIDKAKSWYIDTLPLDIIAASQQDNALDTIGLGLENDRFIRKDMNVRKLVKDYNKQ